LGCERTVAKGVLALVRTHPFVEALSGHVMQSALDPAIGGKARRAGAIRTRRVASRTTLLLVRFRYHLILGRAGEASPLLAEECQVLAFEGAPAEARWLDPAEAELLLDATPDANIPEEQARTFIGQVLARLDLL